MKSYPADIVLSERLWWEELGHQDLPQELIRLLREVVDNYFEGGNPVLARLELVNMSKKELNYVIIGPDAYVVTTRRYLEGTHLFFLSPV